MSAPTIVSFLRVGKRRLEIFNKACVKFGLPVVEPINENCFVLIDDELDFVSANKALKSSSLSPTFIRTQWLSDSIKQNKLLSHESYILRATPSRPVSSSTETLTLSSKNEIPKEQLPVKRDRSISSSASDTDDEPGSKKVFYRSKSFLFDLFFLTA